MNADYKSLVHGSGPHTLPPTPSDIEGPFYKAGAPVVTDLCISPSLFITGTVFDVNGHIVRGAVLDVWHANYNGDYDMDGYRCRGKIICDANGNYLFGTFPPGDYKISDTEYRCAHIHVRVTAFDHKELTTQLYFPDSPHNDTDNWYDARRIVNRPRGYFNFVLEPV